MSQTSLFAEIIKRRVLQITGLYIAATWMMIEIGDWVSGRFHWPPHITSYIFIGMSLTIPSVIYLAYQYGKPGHDPWRPMTLLIIPCNLILAIGAACYWGQPVETLESKTVIDEQGKPQTFEVSKKEYEKNAMVFFWQNQTGKAELDWLQYGLPWLLHKDLNRSLFINSVTPFDSKSMVAEMREAGFIHAVKAPTLMKNTLARKRFYPYAIHGRYQMVGDEISLSIEIIDVLSNQKIAEHTAKGLDYLPLIDELTSAIRNSLKIPRPLEEIDSDLPVAEHASESKLAIQSLVEAQVKWRLENDFERATQLAKQAVEQDFTFAAAYALLADLELLNGNAQAAEKALSQAFKHEYKFTHQEKIQYKGEIYGFRGDYQSQVKVYEMWTNLYPDDFRAHHALSKILTVTGLDFNKALASLTRMRELAPYDDSVLRELANLYLLNDKFDDAILSLETFIKTNPQDSNAMIELADVYQRTGQFEKSEQTLKSVTLFEPTNLSAQIKLSRLAFMRGNYDEAEQTLQALLAEQNDLQKRYQIYQQMQSQYSLRAQLSKVIEISEAMEAEAAHLPSVLVIFQIKFPKILYLASLGEFEQAYQLSDSLRTQVEAPFNDLFDIALITIAITQKDVVKAEQILTRLQAYFIKYPNPIFESALDSTLAQLETLKQDHIKAEFYYQKAIEKTKNSVVNLSHEDSVFMLQTSLAQTLHQNQKTNQAVELLEQVLNRFPAFVPAYIELMSIYLDKNDLEQAKKYQMQIEKYWQQPDPSYLEFVRFKQLREKLQQRSQI